MYVCVYVAANKNRCIYVRPSLYLELRTCTSTTAGGEKRCSDSHLPL